VVQVFVTLGKFQGDLGGLEGADAECQRSAQLAELPGTWVAWLSDDDTNAIDRIPDGQYRLLDDTVIAEDKGALTDGVLEAPIDLNELGLQQDGFVWTGTDPSGTNREGANCSNWTTQTGTSDCAGELVAECGFQGASHLRNFRWTQDGLQSCSESYSLYCFGGGE
jgi:hypothetical protein